MNIFLPLFFWCSFFRYLDASCCAVAINFPPIFRFMSFLSQLFSLILLIILIYPKLNSKSFLTTVYSFTYLKNFCIIINIKMCHNINQFIHLNWDMILYLSKMFLLPFHFSHPYQSFSIFSWNNKMRKGIKTISFNKRHNMIGLKVISTNITRIYRSIQWE